MIELNEDTVKEWSLAVADTISTKFKTNVHFNNFVTSETTLNQCLDEYPGKKWAILCEQKEINQTILTLVSYPSIISTTNNFFSTVIKNQNIENENLTFSERFIANKISDEIINEFNNKEFEISFIRNEKMHSLVHPFHEDESIIIYKFSWNISSDSIGELILCHSHVF